MQAKLNKMCKKRGRSKRLVVVDVQDVKVVQQAVERAQLARHVPENAESPTPELTANEKAGYIPVGRSLGKLCCLIILIALSACTPNAPLTVSSVQLFHEPCTISALPFRLPLLLCPLRP